MWDVKHRVGLPEWDGDNVVGTTVKEPGDTISKAEMNAARQSDEDIKALVSDDAIEEH